MSEQSSRVASPANDTRSRRVIPFGKYLLLERLAVGGMAEVYLAKSVGIAGFEKLVAIKRILPTMAEDHDFITMFIDEAKIAGHLNHANIVPIYELGKIGDAHYIAMEFVWGKDLLQMINRFRRLRSRMPPAMAAWVASRICAALDYAHRISDAEGKALHLIHRDVSPQNILINYSGQVKLIDFGIAKAASRTTKTEAGVLKGKFGYMSPEQVRGRPVDHRSDIFGVGTCFYEMLTCDRLFLGDSDLSTLEKVREARVVPPSSLVEGISAELDDIVMRALARDPRSRYQSAAELQQDLEKFLSGGRPPFGTNDLAEWMQSAFGPEMGEEKARLDTYAHLGRGAFNVARESVEPGRLGNRRSSPSVEHPAFHPPSSDRLSFASVPPEEAARDSELSKDSTAVVPSPFDDDPWAALSYQSSLADSATEIFFSALDRVHTGPSTGGHSVSASVSAQDASAAHPDLRPVVQEDGRPEEGHRSAELLEASATFADDTPIESPRVVGDSAEWRAPPIDYHARPRALARKREPASAQMVPRGPTTAVTFRVAVRKSRSLAALFTIIACMTGLGVLSAWALMGRSASNTLEVRTLPPVAAAIDIDGVPRGRAPLRIEGMAGGERLIRIRAEGFHEVTRRVVIQEGVVALLEVALLPLPPSLNAEAEVGAHNEAVAAAPGEQARAADEPPSRGNEASASKAESSRASEASPNDASFGALSIDTLPASRVFLDGEDTGKNTPVSGLKVRAGVHRLGFRTASGRMHFADVRVESGQTLKIVRRL